jgi:26S proteasome regulatory subunit N3
MGDDKPHINGTEPVENGVSTNGTSDVEMKDDSSDLPTKAKQGKDKDGDEEMTVAIPPSKGSKLSGDTAKGREDDVPMEGTDQAKDEAPAEIKEDPIAKTVSGKPPQNRFQRQRDPHKIFKCPPSL